MTRSLTPIECGRALGCSKDQILALIANGELRAFNVGNGKQRLRYRVEEDELEAFKKRRATKPAPTTRSSRQAPVAIREWV